MWLPAAAGGGGLAWKGFGGGVLDVLLLLRWSLSTRGTVVKGVRSPIRGDDEAVAAAAAKGSEFANGSSSSPPPARMFSG